jgi:hypothetical protein
VAQKYLKTIFSFFSPFKNTPQMHLFHVLQIGTCIVQLKQSLFFPLQNAAYAIFVFIFLGFQIGTGIVQLKNNISFSPLQMQQPFCFLFLLLE